DDDKKPFSSGGFSFKLDSKITFGNSGGDQEPKKLFPTTTFTNPISLFSNVGKNVEDSNATGDGDNDDEQPPKVQSIEHNEDDAVYTKK
ncbi:hypothetical protein BLA29_011526, partial [Euroglyphus maynei]